jgi:hypothetical protein
MFLEKSEVARESNKKKEVGLPHNFHFQILSESSLTSSFVLSVSESFKGITLTKTFSAFFLVSLEKDYRESS